MEKTNLPEVIVALLQVNSEPWKSIYEQGQLPTWIKSCPKNIRIINIYGRTPNKIVRLLDKTHEKLRWSPLLQGPIHVLDRKLNNFLRKQLNPKWKIEDKEHVSNLIVDVPSMILTLPIVELALFKYFLKNTSAQYLYISNTSSYLNLNELNNLIINFPNKKTYGGTMHIFSDISFASGANRIISRDLINNLVDNFNKWDFSYVEDVSMGKMIMNEQFNLVTIPRLVFTNIKEIEDTELSLLNKTVQFRLKSGNLNSRNDIELMNYLHNKLTLN